MTTLFQYCNHCKTEKNFDPNTMMCKVCNKLSKSYNYTNKK